MGEFQRKWFQIAWACLFIVSFSISRIRHSVDAAWAHSAGIELLDRILLCITLVVTVIICVLQGINYWRQSKRLFYRKWRRWGSAIALGIILAVVLLLVMRFVKGDSVALDTNDKRWILALFSIGMLIYLFGRYKFKNWHNED